MTEKEVRQRLVLAPVHTLMAPGLRTLLAGVVTDSSRPEKTLRSQDALKAEQGLGMKAEKLLRTKNQPQNWDRGL